MNDLKKVLLRIKSKKILVFDLETNGLAAWNSVLSCSAKKFSLDLTRKELTEKGVFERYYYCREKENRIAIKINGLTKSIISNKRNDKEWPEYFDEDSAFKIFCNDVFLIVAHNLSFDLKFTPYLRKKMKFCTMKGNIIHFGKYPKLSKLAHYYNIDFDESQLHSSSYDVDLTSKILQKMIINVL